MRFKTNRAMIRVLYPDGCRHSLETLADVDLATDAVKFAAWLRQTADEIEERATTDGMCAAKVAGA